VRICRSCRRCALPEPLPPLAAKKRSSIAEKERVPPIQAEVGKKGRQDEVPGGKPRPGFCARTGRDRDGEDARGPWSQTSSDDPAEVRRSRLYATAPWWTPSVGPIYAKEVVFGPGGAAAALGAGSASVLSRAEAESGVSLCFVPPRPTLLQPRGLGKGARRTGVIAGAAAGRPPRLLRGPATRLLVPLQRPSSRVRSSLPQRNIPPARRPA
jgi:hypothetical protein